MGASAQELCSLGNVLSYLVLPHVILMRLVVHVLLAINHSEQVDDTNFNM